MDLAYSDLLYFARVTTERIRRKTIFQTPLHTREMPQRPYTVPDYIIFQTIPFKTNPLLSKCLDKIYHKILSRKLHQQNVSNTKSFI